MQKPRRNPGLFVQNVSHQTKVSRVDPLKSKMVQPGKPIFLIGLSEG